MQPSLSPGAFDGEASCLEFCHQRVAMVALDFDYAIFYRPTAAALLFQPGSEFLQFVTHQWDTGYNCYALTLSGFCFTGDAYNPVTLRDGLTQAALALIDWTPTIRA
jgi:hypothetical protein